jgi:hypothetical protein
MLLLLAAGALLHVAASLCCIVVWTSTNQKDNEVLGAADSLSFL